MSKKYRPDKNNTIVFPEIHDVEVRLLEVAINYKKLSSREFRKEQKEENPESQARNEEGTDGAEANGGAANDEENNGGNANENATDEAAGGGDQPAGGKNEAGGDAKKENKKKWVDKQNLSKNLFKSDFSSTGPVFPNYLQATCKYRFNTETIMLCFYTTHDWSLMSLTGNYEFTKQAIGEHDFQEIDGDDFTFNMKNAINMPGAKMKQFRLDLKKIDRNVLMQRFNIKIMYMYLDDLEMQVYDNSYAIFVSFL